MTHQTQIQKQLQKPAQASSKASVQGQTLRRYRIEASNTNPETRTGFERGNLHDRLWQLSDQKPSSARAFFGGTAIGWRFSRTRQTNCWPGLSTPMHPCRPTLFNFGEHAMTRTEYRKARRLIRDNGRYALRWMTAEVFAVMDSWLAMQDSTDRLAERADIVAYCARQGIACNPRQTA